MTSFVARKHLCLFLDIDGTLIEFASRPDSVSVPMNLKEDLARAHVLLDGAIAFVSGRTIREIDNLFAPLRFAAAGVHGAELRVSPNAEVASPPSARLADDLWIDITRLVAQYPGALAENKTFGYAVHFRNAPQFGQIIATAMEELVEAACDPSLMILQGHGVVEVKKSAIEKGQAIDVLMKQPAFQGRIPVFIGDDATDIPAFAAALRLGGYAYSVGHVRADLTGSFESPAQVRLWLANLVKEAEAEAR